MPSHIAMMLAFGGIGLGILGFAFGVWFERMRRVGPLVDENVRLRAQLKKGRG